MVTGVGATGWPVNTLHPNVFFSSFLFSSPFSICLYLRNVLKEKKKLFPSDLKIS